MIRFAKLKEQDLKRQPRNNYSTINNEYKLSSKHENEEVLGKKLTVSYQFPNKYANRFVKNPEKDNNQWTSTITGLFDDTKSIKCLK